MEGDPRMSLLVFKRKVLIIGAIIGIGVSLVLLRGGYSKPNPISSPTPSSKSTLTPTPNPNEKPHIVSTKPDPLEEAIISATENLEITFNRPLENVGEFKVRIDPKIDFKVELSGDRKTAKIIPVKPYELGTTYTLFIGTETKFDGVGRWGEEKIFHFRTVRYRGI